MNSGLKNGGKSDGDFSLKFTIAEQKEEILGKSDDMEFLTRNTQIKDDFMKDIKVQLVDPKDIPDMKCLTPKFFSFRKKFLESLSRNFRKTKTTVATDVGRVGK